MINVNNTYLLNKITYCGGPYNIIRGFILIFYRTDVLKLFSRNVHIVRIHIWVDQNGNRYKLYNIIIIIVITLSCSEWIFKML